MDVIAPSDQTGLVQSLQYLQLPLVDLHDSGSVLKHGVRRRCRLRRRQRLGGQHVRGAPQSCSIGGKLPRIARGFPSLPVAPLGQPDQAGLWNVGAHASPEVPGGRQPGTDFQAAQPRMVAVVVPSHAQVDTEVMVRQGLLTGRADGFKHMAQAAPATGGIFECACPWAKALRRMTSDGSEQIGPSVITHSVQPRLGVELQQIGQARVPVVQRGVSEFVGERKGPQPGFNGRVQQPKLPSQPGVQPFRPRGEFRGGKRREPSEIRRYKAEAAPVSPVVSFQVSQYSQSRIDRFEGAGGEPCHSAGFGLGRFKHCWASAPIGDPPLQLFFEKSSISVRIWFFSCVMAMPWPSRSGAVEFRRIRAVGSPIAHRHLCGGP